MNFKFVGVHCPKRNFRRFLFIWGNFYFVFWKGFICSNLLAGLGSVIFIGSFFIHSFFIIQRLYVHFLYISLFIQFVFIRITFYSFVFYNSKFLVSKTLQHFSFYNVLDLIIFYTLHVHYLTNVAHCLTHAAHYLTL